MTGAPILAVEGLVAGRGRADVLRSVSLSAEAGAVTCLIGPNGAGKTTLMMAIAGLIRPRRGRIRFDGREIAGRPAHRLVAEGLALVPQDRLLFAGLTVRENLAAGALSRDAGPAIETDIARMGQRFPRLAERAGQRAGSLSGGEQQMLAIARALMARPRFLLLDEPSLGLAPLVAREVLDLIAGIAGEGIGVLVVEQNAARVRSIARRMHVIDRGRIVHSGAPDGAAADAAVDRAFFGAAVAPAGPAPAGEAAP
ncbi:MAG: ABC transporter ATP-binding protein [Azospirillaceae bacterium]